MDDIEFIGALEQTMSKGDRANWLHIWIGEDGKVRRTKKHPDSTDDEYDEGHLVLHVPPFLHESNDTTIEKFLRPKQSVGQQNGGPKTEQHVKWHEQKQKMLREALFSPTEQDKHTLNVVADLGPLSTQDALARLGLTNKPQIAMQSLKRLMNAKLIKQNLAELWVATKEGRKQAMKDVDKSEKRYGKQVEGQTEGYINAIKAETTKGQKKLFDFDDLIDTDALFDDVEEDDDGIDSLFD